MNIERCTDITLLSRLFRELAEDERSDTKRNEDDYFAEMSKAIDRGLLAFLFTAEGKTVGYALADINRKPVYLYHFYVCRGERRKGCGRAAFYLLLHELNTSEIDLDVFVWNERGRAFWDSLGFRPRATIMRYSAPKNPTAF